MKSRKVLSSKFNQISETQVFNRAYEIFDSFIIRIIRSAKQKIGGKPHKNADLRALDLCIQSE